MSGDLTTIPDRQLARQLGDALRALARAEDSRRPRAATLAAARERVEELRREMGARLIDGRWSAWDSLGVRAAQAERRTGGSVYHDAARSRWIAELTINGQRARKITATKDEATRWLDTARQRAADGMDTRESKWTVAGWLDHLLDDVWPMNLRPATLRNHRDAVERWWRPTIGGIPLRSLRPEDVQKVVSAMRHPDTDLSANSVRIALAPITKGLNEAKRHGLVTRNVVELVAKPKLENRRESRYLTPPEARAVLAACVDAPLGDAVALALLTGLRRAELLALAWDRVTLDGPRPSLLVSRTLSSTGVVEERTKTDKSRRTVILPTAAVEVLRRRRDRQRFQEQSAEDAWSNPRQLVFTDAIGGPIRGDTLTKAVGKLTREVTGTAMGAHSLRHSAATMLAEAGVSAKITQGVLGHATESMTTRVYTHALPEQFDRAAAALDALLG